MRTSTAAALVPALPHLATLTSGSKAVKQSKNRLRFYRPEKRVDVVNTPAITEAVKSLMTLGASVTVYDDTHVWHPSLHGDLVVWSQGRPTSKAREGVTVQISL